MFKENSKQLLLLFILFFIGLANGQVSNVLLTDFDNSITSTTSTVSTSTTGTTDSTSTLNMNTTNSTNPTSKTFNQKVSNLLDTKSYYGYTNETMASIKNLNVPILNEGETECPYYSKGPRVLYSKLNNTAITICDMSFACQIEEGKYEPCVYFKSNYSHYFIGNKTQYSMKFINENDSSQKLYIHSCIAGDINCKNPYYCKENEECYSNHCVEGRCLVNNKKLQYICQVKRVMDNFTIGCTYDINQKCDVDELCYTGKCNSVRKLCHDQNVKYQANFVHNNFFIFIGIVMIVLLTFILYIYTIKDKLLNRIHVYHDDFLSSPTEPTTTAQNSPSSSISDTNERYTNSNNNNNNNNDRGNATNNDTNNDTSNRNTTNNDISNVSTTTYETTYDDTNNNITSNNDTSINDTSNHVTSIEITSNNNTTNNDTSTINLNSNINDTSVNNSSNNNDTSINIISNNNETSVSITSKSSTSSDTSDDTFTKRNNASNNNNNNNNQQN